MRQESTLSGRYLRAALLAVPLFAAPIVGGAAMLAVVVARGSGPSQIAVPSLMLLGLLVFSWKKRYRPGRWTAAAAFSGLVAGMIVGVGGFGPDLSGTPLAGVRLPLSVFAGIGLFALLANLARRLLVAPLVPELARSPLEIPVRGRTSRSTTIYLGTGRLSVNLGRSRGPNGRYHVFEPAIPLERITSIERFELGESEPIVPSDGWVGLPTTTSGPGLRVSTAETRWSLPTDDADVAVEILRRRVGQCQEHARTADAP